MRITMDLTKWLSFEADDIEKTKQTKLEDIADELAKIVVMPVENWELLLLSALSPYAPNIKINGIEQRGNIHTNMVGEISTAKSSILKILRNIMPKARTLSKVTPASIEGTVTPKGEIVAGVVEEASDGILLIPEYKKQLSKFQIMREAMDCDIVTISKRAITWSFKANATFIAGSNPKNDFFAESGIMRNEIPFEEGILSRFDVVLPLIIEVDKMAEIVSMISLSGERQEIDFFKYKLYMGIFAFMMSQVKAIKITAKQEKMLKDAYLRQNAKMGNRPRVILRDLETLVRLANAITALYSYKRKVLSFSVYQADDEDIEKAIDLWNYLIGVREQVYSARSEKELKTVDDMILDIVKQRGEVNVKELGELTGNRCSQATLYRKLKKLEAEGKVLYTGKSSYNAKVQIKNV